MKQKTLNIFGYIGDPWSYTEDPAIIDTNIKSDLSDITEYDELNVHINSYGGIATQGIAIYNIIRDAVRNAKKQKPNFVCNTIVEGIAASAASIIFCAGDNRIMRVGSQLMIHNAISVIYGNSVDLRKEAEVLDQYDQSIASIYAYVGNKSKEDYLAAMNAETYYTADESVDVGLATSVDSAKESVHTVLPFARGDYQNFMRRAAFKRTLPQITKETKENVTKKATNKALASAIFAVADELS